jgi:CxxC motif-containing protein (DUF1111 family)
MITISRLVTLLAITAASLTNLSSAAADDRERRFRHQGPVVSESGKNKHRRRSEPQTVQEAPTGFDNLTNGYLRQGPPFDQLTEDNVVALRSFNDNRFIFEETETIDDGVGPVYNAQSCRECHENVVTGGSSQVAEHRTGRLDGDTFFESPGGSLIHSRAIDADIVERVLYEDDVRTFRLSTNTLGAGFVEAIANETLLANRDGQPVTMRGRAVTTAVLEAGGAARIGRFGWKSQHASLVSFAADAYLNEMGITSPLLPEENTSSGRDVSFGTGFDTVADPEDDGDDVVAFADFMRSTKAPPRGGIDSDVEAGDALFNAIGCGVCHTPTFVTAPAGEVINGGTFTIPRALGDKIIHPYSDFLLHDIGTGDGIPVLPTPEFADTANQMRSAPLWGLRTRNRLMHDGLTFTVREAIERHGGQASESRDQFDALMEFEQDQLLAFLNSL